MKVINVFIKSIYVSTPQVFIIKAFTNANGRHKKGEI
jgi:hypothetical protein